MEALRSGKYEQGKYALRSKDDNYCCLGVLCEVAVKNGVKLKVILGEADEVYWYDEANGCLPKKVAKWAGLTNYPETGGELLSRMNDMGNTFEVIANKIEKGL